MSLYGMFISSHVTAIVTSYMISKFGIRKKVQERSNKNLIEVLVKTPSQSDKMVLNYRLWKKFKFSATRPYKVKIKGV